eukprot:TRINITY_DN18756_c0_g2_i2.p1 TRINITY_DN18756_c0_g2~~TRINITY_DN18756_c0_g2_i2.p1  ORF type:complete len:716 (+),score=131.85 TRINITY_DN18756_c0_g2_i2:82-2148(+)
MAAHHAAWGSSSTMRGFGSGQGMGAASSGEGGPIFEQSPAARSNKAPSEPPSDFSSWHDDASSTLATGSAGDLGRIITVNMQHARMGEHLKGKLQGMIRQSFENYLRIIQTLQNDTGKLAALECELRLPIERNGSSASARTSISCNEDGTFLVYSLPEVLGSAAVPGSLSASSAGSQPGGESSTANELHSAAAVATGGGSVPRVAASSAAIAATGFTPGLVTPGVAAPVSVSDAAAAVAAGYVSSTPAANDAVAGGGPANGELAETLELTRRWVEQVSEYGLSGRCHSLTALFHFGYNSWKQMMGGSRASSRTHLWADSAAQGGQIAEEDELRVGAEGSLQRFAGAVATGTGQASTTIGQVEPPSSPPRGCEDLGVPPSPQSAAMAAMDQEAEHPRPESGPAAAASSYEETAAAVASEIAAATQRPPVETAASIFEAAQLAASCEHDRQALELCAEGMQLVRQQLPASSGPRVARSRTRRLPENAASTSTSSSAAPPLPPSPAGKDDEVNPEAFLLLWQFLVLRASLQERLRQYTRCLKDAEELISLQPTCAEGYYWQFVALQGLDHTQEASEALLSALEYEPQNPLFQQAFTSLFDEISGSSAERPPLAAVARAPRAPGARGASSGARAPVPNRRSRAALGDALSTTTQATHLSSRSTTPTEVSAPLSRSSSDDDLYAGNVVFEEHS